MGCWYNDGDQKVTVAYADMQQIQLYEFGLRRTIHIMHSSDSRILSVSPLKSVFVDRAKGEWLYQFLLSKGVADYGIDTERLQAGGALGGLGGAAATMCLTPVTCLAGIVAVVVGAIVCEPIGCTTQDPGTLSDQTEYDQETDRRLVAEAENGDVDAAYNLGKAFTLRRNPDAWKWLCQAADAGHGGAQMMLGHYHRSDIQLSDEPVDFRTKLRRDDRVAYMWFRLAEKGGAPGAKAPIELMLDRFTPDQLAEVELMVSEWTQGECPIGP